MEHKVLEAVQTEPWCIKPEVLATIHEVLYERLVRGSSSYVGEYKARNRNSDSYVYSSGEDDEGREKARVRVIPIHGVLTKRGNFFSDVSGMQSMELIHRDVKAAMDDPTIDAIVLDIDSPGGTVNGTQELAQLVRQARAEKEVVAVANGQMASAAYWIGSAADEIFATANTTDVGSIGVVSMHSDFSARDEKEGIKRTYVATGKYKAAGNDAEPLGEDAKAYIQSLMDGVHTAFVDSVAKARGVDVAEVRDKWADGKVFLADEAIQMGMIDGILSLDDAIKYAAQKAQTKKEGQMELAELQSQVTGMQAEITQLQNVLLQKDATIAALTVENKHLGKELALTQERLAANEAAQIDATEAATADEIMASTLATSRLNEKLQGKIKTMLNFRSYKVDGEVFSKGSNGAKAFEAAFKAEVEDWESNIPVSRSAGIIDAKTDSSDGNEDVEYGRRLARAYVGKIRSDE